MPLHGVITKPRELLRTRFEPGSATLIAVLLTGFIRSKTHRRNNEKIRLNRKKSLLHNLLYICIYYLIYRNTNFIKCFSLAVESLNYFLLRINTDKKKLTRSLLESRVHVSHCPKHYLLVLMTLTNSRSD